MSRPILRSVLFFPLRPPRIRKRTPYRNLEQLLLAVSTEADDGSSVSFHAPNIYDVSLHRGILGNDFDLLCFTFCTGISHHSMAENSHNSARAHDDRGEA